MNNKSVSWINSTALTLANIGLALLATVIVLSLTGINIGDAIAQIYYGAFGSQEGRGYTLYYATNFIFSGLGVALAWHAGLFNIGGEGQATLGGLGVAIICLQLDGSSLWMVIPASMLFCALFGALWAFIPAWLNAYRGSNIVITTIMFNLIASSLLVYLLANVLKAPGQMAAISESISASSALPSMQSVMALFGVEIVNTPLNISFIWALLCCIALYYYLWHTKLGYETRVVGKSEQSAHFAGIKPAFIIIITMMISGALIGFIGLNEVQGNNLVLNVDFVAGFGFAGIAVALMGRNSPLGIIIASVLFGALYQGGSELAFNEELIGNNIIFLIQGLVVLFCGALQWMLKPTIDYWLRPADVSNHEKLPVQ
ncbi:ABC transporter permease [Psychrobium sp. MM17-31]|uniref:ABC transporter permease n=1 Tax=Psychrobium sp. MM17-31 TaxID=2917758 RepID=UPI001EF5A62B|nr:ABC transporter permease [Psychrobium sp. MM17-31]